MATGGIGWLLGAGTGGGFRNAGSGGGFAGLGGAGTGGAATFCSSIFNMRRFSSSTLERKLPNCAATAIETINEPRDKRASNTIDSIEASKSRPIHDVDIQRPVGKSINSHGTLNRFDKCAASALTPKVSVA